MVTDIYTADTAMDLDIYTPDEIEQLPDPATVKDELRMRTHMHISSNPLENLLYDVASEQFDATIYHDRASLTNFFVPDE